MADRFTPLQQRTLQVAKRLVGKKESTGRNDGWIARLCQRIVDPTLAWLERQPWCVCFVVYCVHTASAEICGRSMSRLPKVASSTLLYNWFRKNGYLLAKPIPGCIGMVKAGRKTNSDGSTRGKSHTHTFLVHDVQGDEVVGVDGNYRNAVAWSRRPIRDCDFGPIL